MIMTYEEVLKRYYDILELRANRFKLREIGEKYNLSRERIRQILLKKPNPIKLRKLRKPSDLTKHLQKWKKQGKDRTREIVRVRDKHTCQNCGLIRTPEQAKKDGKKLFDVHHLKDKNGIMTQKYDSVKNIAGLITLCHKCHLNLKEHRLAMKKKHNNLST